MNTAEHFQLRDLGARRICRGRWRGLMMNHLVFLKKPLLKPPWKSKSTIFFECFFFRKKKRKYIFVRVYKQSTIPGDDLFWTVGLTSRVLGTKSQSMKTTNFTTNKGFEKRAYEPLVSLKGFIDPHF